VLSCVPYCAVIHPLLTLLTKSVNLHTDYKQAYDTINRAELVEIMEEFGIPMKLVRLVKMTLANT